MPEAIVGSVMLPQVVISLLFALALPSAAAARRLRVLLPVFYLVCVGPAPVGAVCPHCKDSIAGCTGGTACPLVADLAANVAGFESGSLSTLPEVRHLIPPRLLALFSRSVLEQIVATATAPLGSAVDLRGQRYTSATSVVQAALFGHCSMEEASLELTRRMEAATEMIDVTRLSTALDALRTKVATTVPRLHGVYTYIWNKVAIYVSAPDIGRIAASATKDASSVVKRPASERDFYETVHLWVYAVYALGLASIFLLHAFVNDVVWKTLRDCKESWQVVHELVLAYIRKIEDDPSRALHFGNVYAQGGQDTLMLEARTNSATFFRSGGGTPLEPDPRGSPKKWNGKDSPDAKPCVAWNNGRACDKVDSDGRCRFAHVCMQWVTDKGANGRCLGAHPFTKCTYDESKKCRAAAKQ